MNEIALVGGKPVRENLLPYGRQYIDEADIRAVTDVMKSDFLTCGPKMEEFEKKLCGVISSKYAVSLSSGTAALHAACFAAGVTAGDEVITTPMTFAASANCVLYCGGKPVFADIDPQTWNISAEDIERKITEKTKAVIAVDFAGQACDYEKIKKICEKHHLILIEDAAHSIGTKYNSQPVGGIADMTTFSFHPVKTVTSGEGGAVATDDPSLYGKLAMFRTHGITRDTALLEDNQNGGWYYEQQFLGYNYRMNDMQSALCMSQLDKIAMFAARRKEIAGAYDEAFAAVKEISAQRIIPQSDTVRHFYSIRLKGEALNTGRKTVYEALRAENIGVNVHYIPVYYHPYYRGLGYPKGLCPVAESLYENIITLPLFYAMTDRDVSDVITAVKKVVTYYKK
jgi:UDP-4-amino-4,6-dideoxy-N-acetyl-beta-L-altrosamine transaminase